MQTDPAWLFISVAALFGLLVGSFLNVCIYRIPRDLSVLAPRSFCPNCNRSISWYENIPVLSFLIQGKKCRHCGKSISFRYPLVEISTALLFSFLIARFGWTVLTLKWALFACLTTVLFWTDLELRLLPDELTLGGAVAGLVFSCFIPVSSPLTILLLSGVPEPWRSFFDFGLAVCLLGGPLWLIAKLLSFLRKREALGLGDLKLILLIGSFLGLEGSISALLIGSIAGVLGGILVIRLGGHNYRTYELPLGSFFCLGALAVPFIRTNWG